MWFSRKQVGKVPEAGRGAAEVSPAAAAELQPRSAQITTKRRGDVAEALALDYLIKAGLKLLDRNYRTPGRGGGEIDLVMRAPDGTLVFVEVRQRSGASHGGAAASISGTKQQRIIFAARHYLMRFGSPPPCRFDVLLVQGELEGARGAGIEWLPAAFDAS
jgi:putative endonuclease